MINKEGGKGTFTVTFHFPTRHFRQIQPLYIPTNRLKKKRTPVPIFYFEQVYTEKISRLGLFVAKQVFIQTTSAEEGKLAVMLRSDGSGTRGGI